MTTYIIHNVTYLLEVYGINHLVKAISFVTVDIFGLPPVS